MGGQRFAGSGGRHFVPEALVRGDELGAGVQRLRELLSQGPRRLLLPVEGGVILLSLACQCPVELQLEFVPEHLRLPDKLFPVALFGFRLASH